MDTADLIAALDAGHLADDVVRHHTEMICADLEALRSGRRPARCANPEVL